MIRSHHLSRSQIRPPLHPRRFKQLQSHRAHDLLNLTPHPLRPWSSYLHARSALNVWMNPLVFSQSSVSMSSTARVFRSGVDQAVRYAATRKTISVLGKEYITTQAWERTPASTSVASAARMKTCGSASSAAMSAVGDTMQLTPSAITNNHSIALPWT